MIKKFIPYGRHFIEQDDMAAISEVLKSDWLTTGPYVEKFEQALSKQTTAKHAIACSNGTTALHLATMALGLKKGDTAIVPAITFVATANAVRFCSADVIFSDVNSETGLMEASHFEKALNDAHKAGKKVSAVLPVHLNGQGVNLNELAPLCQKNNIKIIVDGCHAIGSINNGYMVGGEPLADMTCFSFHPVKTIAMGEGGAITTNNDDFATKMRLLRTHGINRNPDLFLQKDLAFDNDGKPNPWYYEMPEIGFNYRASDINCALGFSQLQKINQFIKIRKEITKEYDQELASLAPLVRPVKKVSTCDAVLHLYVALIDFAKCQTTRANVMNILKEEGIGTQVHYLPICHQPYYRKLYGNISVPEADKYYAQALSLPIFVGMPPNGVKRVVASLKKALKI